MSFEYNPAHRQRVYYSPGGSEIVKFPRGNIYTAMNLAINLEVDVANATNNANIPDNQVARVIQDMALVKNSSDTKWKLSGEALATLFRYSRKGVEAASNVQIAVTHNVSNVPGKMHLHCPFHPLDALKPWDFGCDTRGAEWELHITFRDLTAAGTLFGTINAAITAAEAENYIDIELEKLALRPGPNGADSLSNRAPMIVGYRETSTNVTANNPSFSIDIPEMKDYRNVILWTTHFANTLQEVGESDILDDMVKIFDTQDHTYVHRKASVLREDTSLRWALGSSLPAGVYDVNLTKFGSALDRVVSNDVNRLLAEMSVAKQSNATQIRSIFVTQERQ
ncbi:MAG: hypothetical protein H6863_06555 [Rhodospirillales bacterium]|nr:hypothetical protein [Rhodospirillales bacterium]